MYFINECLRCIYYLVISNNDNLIYKISQVLLLLIDISTSKVILFLNLIITFVNMFRNSNEL